VSLTSYDLTSVTKVVRLKSLTLNLENADNHASLLWLWPSHQPTWRLQVLTMPLALVAFFSIYWRAAAHLLLYRPTRDCSLALSTMRLRATISGCALFLSISFLLPAASHAFPLCTNASQLPSLLHLGQLNLFSQFPRLSAPVFFSAGAPVALNTTLKFCASYTAGTSSCCDAAADDALRKQFDAMNVSHAACAAVLKSVLCAVRLPTLSSLFPTTTVHTGYGTASHVLDDLPASFIFRYGISFQFLRLLFTLHQPSCCLLRTQKLQPFLLLLNYC
jgi:hypothetical protein